MGIGGTAARWKGAASRILNLVARPVRTAQGKGDVVVQPYRGYGSRDRVFVIGRVFRQSHPNRQAGAEDLGSHLRDIGRRIARRAVRDAALTARFCGAEVRVETDRDGYFRIDLKPAHAPPADREFHWMELELHAPEPVSARVEVFVPPGRCRFVVISDIDDTIMHTGVANKLAMLWRLFVQDAESRVAFPGAAALYRALHNGAGRDEKNPILYVSRAPWGIYDVLDAFFRAHGIPVGPVLFLREWGISWKSPLPRKAEEHKQDLIRNMLDLYEGLPFVLVGDSGQHDPEVYRQVVEQNPGRVLSVLIRNVSRKPRRIDEIEALAEAVAEAGSSLVLASDSTAMAEHLARLGLVHPEAVGVVAGARDEGDGPKAPTVRVGADEAAGVLAKGEPDEAPPNVVVELAEHRRRRGRS